MPDVSTRAEHRTWKMALACVLSICMLCCLSFGAKQAQAIDVSVDNFTITASVDTAKPDAPSNIDYSLYLVAKAEAVQGYDAFTLSATTPFSDLKSQIDVLNDSQKASASVDSLASLAQSAAAIVASSESMGAAATKAVGTPATNLKAGLYLMVVTPSSMDVATTEGHGLELSGSKWVSYADGSTMRYVFEPQLVTVPTKSATGSVTGSSTTASDLPWVSSVEVTLKYTETTRTGSLRIIKELPEIAEVDGTVSGATFIFDIEGSRDGVVVYSDVATIRFTEPGSNFVVIDNIPIDLDITVTEVYSGATYKPVGPSSQVVHIVPTDPTSDGSDIATVTFTNEYDRTGNRGGSIVNSFANGPDGWTWEHDSEVA